MTSKFVITFIEQLCLNDIFNTIDKQKLMLTSMQQKPKMQHLNGVHQNGRKMIFSFKNGKNIDTFIMRNENFEK